MLVEALVEAQVEVVETWLQLLKVIREVLGEVEELNHVSESDPEVKCPSCITFKAKNRL